MGKSPERRTSDMEVHPHMTNYRQQSTKKYCPSIPKHSLESLARCLLPAIQEYFESEEGKRAFAEWEAQQKD